jgi:hypothetical protein
MMTKCRFLKHKMKIFKWIIFKNPLKARGLHPLGAPSVHPVDFLIPEDRMLISKAWNENLWAVYFQKPTQSSKCWLPKHDMKTRCWSPKHQTETFEKAVFTESLKVLETTPNRCIFGAPITRMEIKPQTHELDLESLGWLFQNQLKDWGLVGDRYPLGPLEGKKASRKALGLLSRKAIPLWARGGLLVKWADVW